MPPNPDYETLYYWVQQREAARIHKNAGGPPPYSTDPILASYRFCNVRREDDRVTIWIRKNIREPFADHPRLWHMLCIARQINWPDSLAELIRDGAWPNDEKFDPRTIAEVLNARKTRGEKIYTGAYMISAPQVKGADKQLYIACDVIGDLWRRRDTFPLPVKGLAMKMVHRWIMMSNGWGNFMAYQAVVDMRFTRILRDAPDVGTWAAAGPGTIRGLNRIHRRPTHDALDQTQALREMRRIYADITLMTGVAMDFSDVPNILCETDKYLRVVRGEGTPRARYIPGRGH